MCNSAGDAAAAALDRSTANLRHACTTRDIGLEMHKHRGQTVRMEGSRWAVSSWVAGSGAGLGLQDVDAVSAATQMGTDGLS